jgi:cytochrome c peroxidase
MQAWPSVLALALAASLSGAGQERELAVQARELASRAPFGLDPWDAPAEDEARAELGARLFFDPILSADRSVSCASCHDPARGFADGERFSRGVAGARTARNAPTLWNRAFGTSFFWDGRSATLEEQVLRPIEDEHEMALPLGTALERLAADASYAPAFSAAHGRPPDRDALASSLAAFVRRQFRGDSPVDRFRAGDAGALTSLEQAGLWIYESRGSCWHCHAGANFTDEAFHATGIGVVDGLPEPGREAVTGATGDRGRFKTPTLRGVALTAPYMHDGSLATLTDVVEFYRKRGIEHAERDPAMSAIELREDDVPKLVAFLEALSREAGPAEGR